MLHLCYMKTAIVVALLSQPVTTSIAASLAAIVLIILIIPTAVQTRDNGECTNANLPARRAELCLGIIGLQRSKLNIPPCCIHLRSCRSKLHTHVLVEVVV